MHRRDRRIPRRVAEEQPAGEGVRADVGEPGVNRVRDPPFGGIGAGQVIPPDLAELGEVALQQAPVEVLLGFEMVVDDGRADSGPLGDLVDRGGVIAALGEELGGGGSDHLAAFRRRHPPAGRRRPASWSWFLTT